MKEDGERGYNQIDNDVRFEANNCIGKAVAQDVAN